MGVFFSIIIPVYNGEQYIKNCLDSIYRQGLGHRLFRNMGNFIKIYD